jgi:redox-sensitive bicupin YhaK (pirin superfamily)
MSSMIHIRRSNERGHANHGWLDSYHTFSFADYYDPAHMGFSDLRVINEDRVEGGHGFPPHPHRDMEIVTYMLGGALAHLDSMGNSSVIRAGEVQRMSAGTGVVHSEYNASEQEPAHLLQIWILPERSGIQPGYEQKMFDVEEKRGKLRLLVSPDGRDGSLKIFQDIYLYGTVLEAGTQLQHTLAPGRRAYIQIARGNAQVGSELLAAGDGAAVTGTDSIVLQATTAEPAEILLFDLR